MIYLGIIGIILGIVIFVVLVLRLRTNYIVKHPPMLIGRRNQNYMIDINDKIIMLDEMPKPSYKQRNKINKFRQAQILGDKIDAKRKEDGKWKTYLND